MSIPLYSDYMVSESSMYDDWILKAPQVALRTENIYGPIRVSTDEDLNVLTEQELNRERSKMRGEMIIAVIQEHHG